VQTVKSSSALLGLPLVLALAFVWVANPASAAPLGAGANVIVVHAQDVDAGQVIVDSVTAAQDGWLLIRKDVNGAPGDMIGFAPIHKGTTTYVRADIQPIDFYGNDNITPTLWATLVADPNALAPLTVPDVTITQEPSVVVVAFSSTAGSAAAPAVVPAAGQGPTIGKSSSRTTNANKITVPAQDATNGQVTVVSVTAAQNSWLLIRKDANGRPGRVLGFAPMHQGVNTNVTVDIRVTNAKGEDIATPVLWATLVADSNALNPFAMPDATVQQEDSLATVAFSIR
jgi:hypothetical protein